MPPCDAPLVHHCDRHPDIRRQAPVERDTPEAFGRDTDDRKWIAVDPHGAPEDIGVAAEIELPDDMTDDDHISRSFIPWQKISPQRETDAEHRKVVPRDHLGPQSLCPTAGVKADRLADIAHKP